MRAMGVVVALALTLTACSAATDAGSPTSQTPATTTIPSAGSTGTPATTSQPPDAATTTTNVPVQHRIAVRVVDGTAEFFDRLTDEPFVVRGVNYVFVHLPDGRWGNEPFDTRDYDPALIRSDFARIAAAGYNTVRMFFDQCGEPPGCIANPGRDGLDPAYLDNIVDVIEAAADNNLFLLLTSNDIPDFGGYGEASNRGASDLIAGYRNAHYLTAAGQEAAAGYWDDFMTGIVERGARLDHVLGWSLLNEQWLFGDQPPLSLAAGSITTANGETYDMSDDGQKQEMVAANMLRYASLLHDVITEHDPTALVTMGFFAPQFPNPTGIGGSWFVDTASYIERGAPLDFYDFHAYPGEDIPLDEIAENFGVPLAADKPVVMGEYGAFIQRFEDISGATRALSDWTVESCALGFDGWLYWSYRTNPTAGDSTWGFTSEDGYLLDALSPNARPDPCAPIPVDTDNLAYQAHTTASRSLEDQPPDLAVDENETTQWGAGNEPRQWIQVDLDGAHDVGRIRLLVAQYPAGDTVHRILADQGGGLAEIHRFSGFTTEGDWLTFEPEEPLTDVTTVRIETVSSPSWVAWAEIEITAP